MANAPKPPMPPKAQKAAFAECLSSSLGDECSYEVVRSLHEEVSAMIEIHKETRSPEPLILTKETVKSSLERLGVDEKKIAKLDESFEDSEAFRWLSENAYKYGFILRYPEDKVDTTGYKYEPWHYRFVGRTVAAEIHASDMCLEEYLKLN